MAKKAATNTSSESAPEKNAILEGIKARYAEEVGDKDTRKVTSPPKKPGLPNHVREVLFRLTVQELNELTKGKQTKLATVKRDSVKGLPDSCVVHIAAREVKELLG